MGLTHQTYRLVWVDDSTAKCRGTFVVVAADVDYIEGGIRQIHNLYVLTIEHIANFV